ncbi:hypothetical protein [Shewanella sp. NFH-SH190041]|uniref:hypothetical protein n=1 Tax=Shewanella sp. NFH-SH190041 TaxID=2950245 RepID=UPI0021C3B817|nr:hypothetical protein [Shewanella sp. NFH-SH190041]
MDKVTKKSVLVMQLRRELAHRRGDYPQIATEAGVELGWLYSVMRDKNAETIDFGVRKVESVLHVLGVKVSLD